MSLCVGCTGNYFSIIAHFYEENKEAISFLREHGVLPQSVKCQKCNSECTLCESTKLWRCGASYTVPKTKKQRHCDFTVEDRKGTFLQNCSFPEWKVILFVNHWLREKWDHKIAAELLKVSCQTCIEWHSFCSEVTDYWLNNQSSLGDPQTTVKDKTCVAKCLFMKAHKFDVLVHTFFLQAASLYPPQSEKLCQSPPLPLLDHTSKEDIEWVLPDWPGEAFLELTQFGLVRLTG